MAAVNNRWTTLLQVLLSLLACITKLSCGFNAATTLPSSSVHVKPSVLTSKSFARYNRTGESSYNKCSLLLQAHHDDSTAHPAIVGNPHNHCSGSSLRNSGLFHQRQPHHRHDIVHTTSRLQMTTTSEDTNNDISSPDNGKNPLVRIWLKLRVFMARLWVSRSRNIIIAMICHLFFIS